MAFIKIGDATPILKILSEDELKKEKEKLKEEKEAQKESHKKDNSFWYAIMLAYSSERFLMIR